MRIRRHRGADQRGFTLAELLIAIAIVGLVMAGTLTLLMSGNQTYLTGANQVEAQGALRATIERMTGDIREAGFDPRGNGFAAVTNETPTGFTLQNDWNGNGAIEPAIQVQMAYPWAPAPGTIPRGEQVIYAVDGAGNLTRQESADPNGAQVLMTSVVRAAVGTNCAGALAANPPIFQYCDGAGGAAVGGNVRLVIVSLTAGVQNQPPAIWQAGAIQVTMGDRIRLRNR